MSEENRSSDGLEQSLDSGIHTGPAAKGVYDAASNIGTAAAPPLLGPEPARLPELEPPQEQQPAALPVLFWGRLPGCWQDYWQSR